MTIATAGRGVLTPQIFCAMDADFGDRAFAGRRIKFLRLMPYLWDCAINRREIEPMKIDGTERAIISELREQGKLTGGASEPIWLSADLWAAIGVYLYMAYVDHHNTRYDDVVKQVWDETMRVEIDIETAARLIDAPRWLYRTRDAKDGLDPWAEIDGLDPWTDGDHIDVWFTSSGREATFNIHKVPDKYRFFTDRATYIKFYEGEFDDA